MGLDSVELAMELENRFRVRLSDAELSEVKTVAGLAAAVVRALPQGSSRRCTTAAACFELRRSFVAQAGVARQALRHGTRVEVVLPRNRRRFWKQLRRDVENVPPLSMPPRAGSVFLWCCGIAFFAWFGGVMVMYGLSGTSLAVVCCLFACIPLTGTVLLVAGLLSTSLPRGIDTLGDLARVVAPVEVTFDKLNKREAVQARVTQEVRRLTADFMGLPLESVQPESEFVRDLGMD